MSTTCSFIFCNDPIHLTSSYYGFVYVVGLFHCFVIAPLALLWRASVKGSVMMMIIMMIMALPCSNWRKGMLAFSSLSPSETVCTVAWRGRLAQEEDGGGGGNREKEFRKRKSPSKVTPSELLSMCEFRHTLLSHIKLEKGEFCIHVHTWSPYYNYCNLIVHVSLHTNTEAIKQLQVLYLCCCCGLFAVQ